jgi:hypothetical protein
LHSLLLKKSPFPEVSIQEIVQQIKGKQVAEEISVSAERRNYFSATTEFRTVFLRKNSIYKSEF